MSVVVCVSYPLPSEGLPGENPCRAVVLASDSIALIGSRVSYHDAVDRKLSRLPDGTYLGHTGASVDRQVLRANWPAFTYPPEGGLPFGLALEMAEQIYDLVAEKGAELEDGDLASSFVLARGGDVWFLGSDGGVYGPGSDGDDGVRYGAMGAGDEVALGALHALLNAPDAQPGFGSPVGLDVRCRHAARAAVMAAAAVRNDVSTAAGLVIFTSSSDDR